MAKRTKQLEFQLVGLKRPQDAFGGSLLKGNNAKVKRPLDSKYPIHLVLRGVRGGMRLPKCHLAINKILDECGHKYGIRIYSRSNVGNHLHLIIKLARISNWAHFIREVAGRVGLLMRSVGATSMGESYWAERPFTRIVRSWGKAFKTLKEYVYLNQLEANGFISRRETRTLRELRLLLADSG